ncbi:MAG: two-component regulator propeller domain-containing protein, partial [bacterium]|nr:two-component regulator propeller domain-containing protein [bacterium]
MQINGRTFLKLSVLSLLILLALSTFFAQQQVELTPTPSPEASPTASPTPTPSPTPLPGAQNFHQWGSITVFNGLPSDSVRAIAQTPDGVMWFGTDNGLARFDGRRIQNFSLGDPEANRILALETVANGDLWIGTRNGAFIYSNLGLTTIENTPGTVITAIVGRGNDIFRAGTESEVVLGTETGFVLVVRKQDSGTRVGTPLFPEPIKSPDGTPAAITGLITTDHGGILAATAGRGVFFVDDGVAESEATLRAPSPFVNAIVRDSDFKVWLGIDATRGGNGVAVAYPDGQPIRITAPTSKVLTLVANEQGSWAGTERYGLFNFV